MSGFLLFFRPERAKVQKRLIHRKEDKIRAEGMAFLI